jgi:hypothetical protein
MAIGVYFLTGHARWDAYVLAVYAVSGAAGLVLSSALRTSRMVRRNLSMLGLIGYPVFLVGSVLAMFNVVDVTHGAGLLALVPGGLFELLLPIWLFTRGFTSHEIEGSTMTMATYDHQSTRQAQVRLAARHRTDASSSVRNASITAGAGLLLMSVLSGIGYLVAVKGLTVPGNATRTAEKIAAHEDLFRFGIVSLFFVAALDVVVAWALCRVFTPVSEAISKLAAGLRIAYAGIFVIAISRLVGVLSLLGTNPQPTAILGRINSFTNIWDAGLVLFGLHLLLIAYLAYRSGYVPKVLGVLLAVAGLGYLFDSLSVALTHGSSTPVSSFTFFGEFLLALWLVIFGRRVTLSDSTSLDSQIVVAQ